MLLAVILILPVEPVDKVSAFNATIFAAVVAVPLTVIPALAVITAEILTAYPVAELPVRVTAAPVKATVELRAVVVPVAVPDKVKLPVVLII